MIEKLCLLFDDKRRDFTTLFHLYNIKKWFKLTLEWNGRTKMTTLSKLTYYDDKI